MLAPRPNTKLENHHFSSVSEYLLNIFSPIIIIYYIKIYFYSFHILILKYQDKKLKFLYSVYLVLECIAYVQNNGIYADSKIQYKYQLKYCSLYRVRLVQRLDSIHYLKPLINTSALRKQIFELNFNSFLNFPSYVLK